MSDILNPDKVITLNVTNEADHQHILKISHALSVPERLQVLQCILKKSMSLSQIQEKLNLPMTSIHRHVNTLQEAGLIYITYAPGIKSHMKFCSQATVGFTISMENEKDVSEKNEVTIEMPVGMFSHCHVSAPCGMLSSTGRLIPYDDPSVFFSPQRMQAEILWFDKGFICYNFPLPKKIRKFDELEFSFEICSETMYYNNKWPSDITLFVNDVELTTFTSPGDFGGRRGKYTPEFWPLTSTQYGLLKTLRINKRGVFLDNELKNENVNLNTLQLNARDAIKFKIGIKEDAEYIGGINLFGKNFGDFPQAIKMTVR